MLTACFDASGKPDQKCIVVAGFCGFDQVWREFEIRWQRRLEADRLPYFHASDFTHSTDVFRQGWKGDEPRRRRLCGDLMEIIRSCGLRKLGHGVPIKDFKEGRWCDEFPGIGPEHAFGYCAFRCVERLRIYAHGEGAGDRVRYVFEHGDPQHDFRKALEYFECDDPHFVPAQKCTDRKGVALKPFIGLQAADWLAYEYFTEVRDYLSMSGRREPQWALEQFHRLPGGVTLECLGPVFPEFPDIKPL